MPQCKTLTVLLLSLEIVTTVQGGFVQLDAWVVRGIPACAWDVLQLQVMDWTFALCRRRRVAQFRFLTWGALQPEQMDNQLLGICEHPDYNIFCTGRQPCLAFQCQCGRRSAPKLSASHPPAVPWAKQFRRFHQSILPLPLLPELRF